MTTLSAEELKGTRTPTITVLPMTSSSRALVDASYCIANLCTTTTEETITLLTNFIFTYALEFSPKEKKLPFLDEEERIDFVVLCLKLLNSQLLALRSSEVNPSMEKLIVDLRNVCFQMLDMELHSKIQKTVAETLSTGGLMLPPLNEKIKLLLTLLKDVKTLSRGQHLLCEIILSSLEDRHRIAQMLGLSSSRNAKDNLTLEELKNTEQLMSSLLATLTEDSAHKLSEDLKDDDEDSALNQRLHFLLSSLHSHMFAYCVCGAEISVHQASANNLGKILWDIDRKSVV